MRPLLISFQLRAAIDSADRLALRLHEEHRLKTLKDALNDKREQRGWQNLDDKSRSSNRACIDHIETKLKALGLSIVRRGAKEPLDFMFSKKQIGILSEMEHGRFVAERLLGGWKLSENRDTKKKLRPNLVARSDLPDFEKDKDRVNVRLIPALLHAVDYKIVESSVTPFP
jgi:hypothetical protein